MSNITVEEATHDAEMPELPEKRRKRRQQAVKPAHASKVVHEERDQAPKISWWERLERLMPVAILLLGLANLIHALSFSSQTEHYREQVDLTERQRRYADLFFALNQANSSSARVDQLAMHGMLAQLNRLAEEPELQKKLSVSDFLALGNLNGRQRWMEKSNFWYRKAFQVADRDLAFDRRSSLVAKLYHAMGYLDSGLHIVDAAQIRRSMEAINAVFARLDPRMAADRDLKFYGQVWFARGLADAGYFRSCSLNVQAATIYAASIGLAFSSDSEEARTLKGLEPCAVRAGEDRSTSDFVL